ncbi:MAG: YciI family protein [Aquisalimonadaceae bacterium]
MAVDSARRRATYQRHYLVEARDLNEAIQIASKIPAARVGSVEVRPIRQLQP